MIRLAIDPGNDGALLICRPDGWQWHRMPLHKAKRSDGKRRSHVDVHGLRQLIAGSGADLVLIEIQTPMRGQGLGSTASIMHAFGLIVGICAGLAVPHQLVRAQDWRRAAKLQPDKVNSLRHLQRACPALATQIAGAPKPIQIAVADCWCMLALHTAPAAADDWLS